jgi:hypothetical protein
MMWGSSTRCIHQRGKLKLTLKRYFANVERVIESTNNAGSGSVIRTSHCEKARCRCRNAVDSVKRRVCTSHVAPSRRRRRRSGGSRTVWYLCLVEDDIVSQNELLWNEVQYEGDSGRAAVDCRGWCPLLVPVLLNVGLWVWKNEGSG